MNHYRDDKLTDSLVEMAMESVRHYEQAQRRHLSAVETGRLRIAAETSVGVLNEHLNRCGSSATVQWVQSILLQSGRGISADKSAVKASDASAH